MTSLNAPLMNAPPANGNFNTMPYNLIPQAPPSGNVAMMGVMGHYMLPWPSLATHESPNHGLVQPSEQHGSGQGGQRQPQAFPQHSGPFSPTPQPLPNSNMNPQQQHQQQQQQQQPWMLHVSPGGPPPPLFVDFNAQFGLAEPAAPASGLLHGLPPFHGPFLSNAPAPNPDNSPGSIGGEHMGQARTVLSSSERSLMNLAIHTALSHGPEARADITAALRSGLSEEQIRAALAYAMEYCNTLACTMAVMTANRVFEEEGPPKDEDGSG
jgi:alkylhydroperoxidase/carboxymuconolactone decarboxylase family protein YurZ